LAFSGGAEQEDTDDFRQRLLNYFGAPGTGSAVDIKTWAENIDGVETATVFENDNLGVAAPGHVTVRLTGPGGAQPTAPVIAAVVADLATRDLATITVHVTNFTQLSTNVSVTLTLAGTYTHSDVDTFVSQVIQDYINSVPVGGTVYVNGIIDAVFGMTGVTNVAVTVPASDQTTPATQKRVPGTITIT
jgi:uncharacterized phage protein gp47/JayE